MITRNNKLLLGILAFIVTLTIGYALFSQTVTVSGTSTASGTFKMQITNATVIEQAGSSGATVTVSGDKQSMSISVPKLEYPGAYVIIDYTIKNMGSINSLLTSVEITGADLFQTVGSTNAVRIQPAVKNVSYSTASSVGFNNSTGFSRYYFEPNDSGNNKMAIYWKSTQNKTSAESANITVSFNFEQVADEVGACEKYTTIYNDAYNCIKSVSNCPSNKFIYDFDFNGLVNAQDITKINTIKTNFCSN